MKRSFLPYVILLALVPGCVGERTYERTAPAPSARVIALPVTPEAGGPKPYEVNGEWYYPLPAAEGFVESGKASWYGEPFHGRRTSSGEVYDMYKKSAAHKTLPLYTLVQVTNLSNGKSIVLTINDRGPFVRGRIIDLSFAAAQEIDLVGPGTADVRLVALGKEVARDATTALVETQDFQGGEFTIQVGAFENQANATRLADQLRVIYKDVNVSMYVDGRNRTLHRVQVSTSRTLDEARNMEKKLEEMGFKDAFVVRM